MAAQPNAALPDGLTLGGYRIVKKIAVGGFSIVYLAEDAEGHAVAIKEYLPSALAVRTEGALQPTVAAEHVELYRIGLKYFFDEGRVLAWSWDMNMAARCKSTSRIVAKKGTSH